jgi:hypothetical protein
VPANTSIYTGADGAISLSVPQGAEGDTAQGVLTSRYIEKYIETSKPDPLFHVCFGGMAFSYLVALPWERAHLAHREEMERTGGKH